MRRPAAAAHAPFSTATLETSEMLEIRQLHKRYGKGAPVLVGIDLIIPKGQVVALIGPSGAGKSTLIRCINRLVEPSSGDVLFNGVSIPALRTGELRKARRKMGMIFQEFALIDRLSVMENVLSGQLGYVGFWRSWLRRFPQPVIEHAFELLDRVGIADQVDKRADQLSGGQRQRVGIARALLQNPDILLIDEPTSGLDPKTSRQIMRLIMEVATEHGLAAIINIHDVQLASMFVERIIGLRNGVVVYDGAPSGLTSEVLTEIYGEEDWTKTGRRHDQTDDEGSGWGPGVGDAGGPVAPEVEVEPVGPVTGKG
jgi:phosphonate transport system ATP-binding protein